MAARVCDTSAVNAAASPTTAASGYSARALQGEPDTAWAAARMERLQHGLHALLPDAAPHWQRVHAVAQVLPPLQLPA